MKYASQTATEKRDYQWIADSEEFRAVAEEEWSRWHDEYADGMWFGLISRQQKLLFLAGKIPTGRYDYAHRRISSFIVLQAENETEANQIRDLTANLLLGKEVQRFCSWADDLAMAQENQTPIPGLGVTETVPQKEGNISVGRCEYPITEDYRDYLFDISASLKYLVDSPKDFVVAWIDHSASTFYKKVCSDLPPNAEIAVFSKSSTAKKKFPEPETKESVIQKGINFMKKYIPTIVLIVLILGMFFSFNSKVKKLNSQINDLQTQIIKKIEELKKDPNEMAEEVESLQASINTESENLKKELANTIEPSIQDLQTSIRTESGELKKLSNTILDKIQDLNTSFETFKKPNDETKSEDSNPAPAPAEQTTGNINPFNIESNN